MYRHVQHVVLVSPHFDAFNWFNEWVWRNVAVLNYMMTGRLH